MLPCSKVTKSMCIFEKLPIYIVNKMPCAELLRVCIQRQRTTHEPRGRISLWLDERDAPPMHCKDGVASGYVNISNFMDYHRYTGYTTRIYSQDLFLLNQQPADIKKFHSRHVYVSECYENCRHLIIGPRGSLCARLPFRWSHFR